MDSDEDQTWIGDFRIDRSRSGVENRKIVDDIIANLSPTEADMGSGIYRIGLEHQVKILKLLLALPKLPFIGELRTPIDRR